jgi:hypothetical protein
MGKIYADAELSGFRDSGAFSALAVIITTTKH